MGLSPAPFHSFDYLQGLNSGSMNEDPKGTGNLLLPAGSGSGAKRRENRNAGGGLRLLGRSSKSPRSFKKGY